MLAKSCSVTRDAESYLVGTVGALEDQELMAKGEDLRVKRGSGAEALPNRVEQRENDREHAGSNV
ncbi:MAG TPA: hypothetical protein VEJ46_02825 [Candidatus Acidoferrum sp.]|nr:hypothetical protein [Candidatus Acidoferrum sp.]